MIYQVIAALAGLGMLGEPFEISEGWIDSSDQSDCSPASWWGEIRVLARDLAQARSTDMFGQPGYRFWRVERSDFQLTFETSTASMWPELEDDLQAMVNNDTKVGMYHNDLVDYASIEGYVDDGAPSASAGMGPPPPNPRLSGLAADSEHDFDPILRMLQAVLELGQRQAPVSRRAEDVAGRGRS